MATSISHLRTLLKNSNTNGLEWYTDLVPEETHGTTPIIGYYQALRKLFIKWDKPLKRFGTGGYGAFTLAREHLEDDLGYKVTFEERTLIGIGYALYERQDYSNAKVMFYEGLKHYPESPTVHAGLAIVSEAMGEIDNAFVAISKAMKLIGNTNSAMADQIREDAARIRDRFDN